MNAKYNLHNKKVNDANCNYVEQKPMSSLFKILLFYIRIAY